MLPYNSRPTGYIKHGTSSGGYRKRTYFDEKTKKVLGQIDTQQPCDYLKTLIDPWADINAKIPDLACYPTSTARFETNFMWPITTAATTANNQFLVVDLSEVPGFFMCQRFGVAGPTPGDYTNGTLSGSGLSAIGPQNIKDFNDQQRLVSAGIQVKFADNDTATKGVIWAYSLPGCCETSQSNTALQSSPYASLASGQPGAVTSTSILQNQKGIYNGPLVNGATLRYTPCDAHSFEMIKPGSWQPTAASYVFNYGRFVIYVEGCADNTMLHVNITTNWEVIPLAENNNVNTSPSPTNGAALEAGLRAISHLDNAFGASPSELNQHIRTPIRSVEKICK